MYIENYILMHSSFSFLLEGNQINTTNSIIGNYSFATNNNQYTIIIAS